MIESGVINFYTEYFLSDASALIFFVFDYCFGFLNSYVILDNSEGFALFISNGKYI